MDISIVILTMNRPARCAETVRRAARAARGLAAEILVVNNGREPVPLPDRVEGLPCRVLTMPRNLGAAARNAGWRESRGRFVLMLDDDALIEPGLPETMIRGLESTPRAGALYFRVHDGQKEEGCLLPTVFHGCACGFRREVLEQTGGYPAGFVYYGEEYDLTFRLYLAGRPPLLCESAPPVFHARDPGGRNVSRIIRFLVRNNAEVWFAYFPLGQAVRALADTLRWYRRVGIKENARDGFRQGCAEAPAAMLRGLARRRLLRPEDFEAVTLAAGVAQAARDIKGRGLTRVTICGVGKLPSLWLGIVQAHGLIPAAFWDRNPAWTGQVIHGVPVRMPSDESWPKPDLACAWLTGTSSTPDNKLWSSQLCDRGLAPNTFAVPGPTL